MQAGGADHHGAMRVAQHDVGAHFDEAVGEHQTAVKHLLVNQHGAARLRGDDQCDADQIGRKARPRHVVDFRHGAVEVAANAQILIRRHHDVVAIVVPGHAQTGKDDAGHTMLARARPLDAKLRAGHRRQGDQGADFHVIRPDCVGRPPQAADAANYQGVAADALDVGAPWR